MVVLRSIRYCSWLVNKLEWLDVFPNLILEFLLHVLLISYYVVLSIMIPRV